MTKPDFAYVTYIATSPEKLWRAVTDPSIARQYWRGVSAGSPAHENVSDWKAGSRWEHLRSDGSGMVDIAGKVIEFTPPRRLAISWARPVEYDDEPKHSRVTFDIDPQGEGTVRLTVTHDGLGTDPKMLAGISDGWPAVLSQLKTFLETGHLLPTV